MLAQERYERILTLLQEKRAVTVTDLTYRLDISESTIRRDLSTLNEKGLLKKVHGGAILVETSIIKEEAVEEKAEKNVDKKRRIADYCAKLVEEDDVIYIDAGTTTEQMIDLLDEDRATYVTNGIIHATKLMKKGYKVYLLGGQVKALTQAIVGVEAVDSILKYHFTKAFLGTNGISLQGELTTSDMNEAAVKKRAIERSQKVYVLADESKFQQMFTFTFGTAKDAEIITTSIEEPMFRTIENVKEI